MIAQLAAPAKLNLVLEVLGKRPDGFHEIRSVLQSLTLADRLELRPATDLTLEAPPETGDSEANLVTRAARLLQPPEAAGAALRLLKRVPVGAGLGGGSSDAAAALRLLAAHWRLAPDPGHLAALAAQLGSDVPFFLVACAALAAGRGERLTALPPADRWFVLAVPPWELTRKTPRVYGAVQPADYTDGALAAGLAERLRDGRAITSDQLFNGLEPAARRLFPELAALQGALEQAAGARFVLSGAGPALFSLAGSRAEAAALAGRIGRLGARIYLTRARTHLPRIRRTRG